MTKTKAGRVGDRAAGCYFSGWPVPAHLSRMVLSGSALDAAGADAVADAVPFARPLLAYSGWTVADGVTGIGVASAAAVVTEGAIRGAGPGSGSTPA